MRWKVHGRRTMYESDWVNVYLDDVELPDGTHIDHHILTMPKRSQTAVVLNDARDHVLMIWRHRFITDKWGWEVPAGWVEPGEEAIASISREIAEETGHAVKDLTKMFSYDAIPGLSSMHFTVWLAIEAGISENQLDTNESTRVEWKALNELPSLLASKMNDGPSITALTTFLSLNARN